MNTDISGLGVRISFYLQTIFLSCQAVRSGSLDEIAGAVYTLIATNIAMAVTALILGLKPEPEISFHDALIVLYLLTLCWVTNTCSLASCNGLTGDSRVLQVFSVIQSLVIFAFALAILITAKTFGSTPQCNPHAVLVFLRPFPVFNAGRIVGWVIIVLMLALYAFMTAKDYLSIPEWRSKKKTPDAPLPTDEEEKPQPETADPEAGLNLNPKSSNPHIEAYTEAYQMWNGEPRPYNPNINGSLILQLCAILVAWALAVMNTELLIVWNHFERSDSTQSIWQFGQILPLFLIVLPMVGMVKAFQASGIRNVVVEAKKED